MDEGKKKGKIKYEIQTDPGESKGKDSWMLNGSWKGSQGIVTNLKIFMSRCTS